MDWELYRIVIDFGLVVLIWLVQLVIYPSFGYYQKDHLVRWHKHYTQRLAYIVMPLMIGQLFLGVVIVVTNGSLLSVISLALIIAVWLSTFLQFVPIHLKITSNAITDTLLKQLVQRNWLRTLLWTLIFVLNCISFV